MMAQRILVIAIIILLIGLGFRILKGLLFVIMLLTVVGAIIYFFFNWDKT